MRLKNKRIAILVEKDYQDLEVWYPALRLREEGAQVIFVGTGSADHYEGKFGYPVKPDKKADQIRSDSLDALIIPGGWAPDFLRRYPAVLQLVRDMNENGKIVSSICHGGWVLASADIVRKRKLTCFSAIKDDLIHAGADYVDEEVVVDKNLITSRMPDDLPAFLRETIKAIEG